MTKHSRSPKTRPVAALLIVVATLFLLAGRACGVVGALLSASTARLLGDAGTGLLVGTAWCIAFILATPPGTLTRMVVALWRAAVTRRHSPAVVVMRAPLPLAPLPAERTPLAPHDRRELDAVRTALKNLGYLRHEYDPVLAKLDPTQGFETLVKSALKRLAAPN